MSKQDKYTKSARGQDCQIRIPGVCNFSPETTVLAHINGGGMATKHHNIHGSYACSACHDMVDGRTMPPVGTIASRKLWHYEGMKRTQDIMIEMGILKL